MRTLTRHLLSQQLGLFAGALVVFFAIGAVAEILGHLDEIVDHRSSGGGALGTLALRISARYATDALPAASFAAVFLCLGLAGRRGELLGLRACGTAPWPIVGPLLITAAGLSLSTLLLDPNWLPDVRLALSKAPPSAPGRSAAEPLWYHSGEAIYSAAGLDADGSPRDLVIFDLDERGRVLAATDAGKARSDSEQWQLDSAVRTRFDPANPLWSTAQALARGSQRAAVPLHEASTLAAGAGVPAALAGRGTHARVQRAALHSRLAQVAAVWVCALLALPLALRVPPGGSLTRPAVLGAGALGLYLGLRAVGDLASTRGWLPPELGVWLAAGLVATAAAAALLPRRR